MPVGNMGIFVRTLIGWATVIRRTEACQSRCIIAHDVRPAARQRVDARWRLRPRRDRVHAHLRRPEPAPPGARRGVHGRCLVGLALTLAGVTPWATLGGAMLAAAALGVVVERVAFRPVRARGSHVTPLMTTIAVGLVLQHTVVKIFGAEPVAFPAPFASTALALGPVALTTLQLLILGTSLGLMA